MASWVRTVNTRPYEIAELIISGITPVGLIVTGTLGNLLSVFILCQKENRRTSTNVYLIFLCIMDLFSLYQWNLDYAVYEFTGGVRQISTQSLFLCKWQQFLAFYTLHTSAMFLTLVSLDRACLLWSRWYKQKIARARVAFILCILVLLILLGVDGFLFGLGVEYTIYDSTTASQITMVGCYYSFDVNLNQFFANQFSWIHLVIMYIVPFTLMLVCTVLTVKKLGVRPTVADNQQLASNAQRNRRISIMLLLMCLSYVVLTLPNRLCFSVFANQIVGHEYADTIFLSTNTLMYTRNVLNAFFLYKSVYGFRRDVRRLMFTYQRKLTGRVIPQQNNGEDYVGAATVVRDPNKSLVTQPTPQTRF